MFEKHPVADAQAEFIVHDVELGKTPGDAVALFIPAVEEFIELRKVALVPGENVGTVQRSGPNPVVKPVSSRLPYVSVEIHRPVKLHHHIAPHTNDVLQE